LRKLEIRGDKIQSGGTGLLISHILISMMLGRITRVPQGEAPGDGQLKR